MLLRAIRVLDVLDEREQAAEVKALSLDRRGVEQRSLLWGEQIKSGGQQSVQRGRESRRTFVLGDVHRELFEEERVAAVLAR